MTDESHSSVADDAVSNRSDDTALDDADAAAERAGEENRDRASAAAHDAEQAGEIVESSSVEPVEAAAAEIDGDAADMVEAEAEVDEEPAEVAIPRGPIEEAVDEPEEIRMDWYILKVQSNRERSIAEALERKMKIEGHDRFFDQVIVPTEKVTEFKGRQKEGRRAKAVSGLHRRPHAH